MSKYVVLDLEMCNVQKKYRGVKYGYSKETIQIGAVLLNENYKIEDTFNTYVKPEYGYIDSFIRKLTGINSWKVKDAPFMKEALKHFLNWIPENGILVSWSNSDRSQIEHEAFCKKIYDDRLQNIYDNWIDCQKLFAEKIGEDKNYKLSDALIAADIDSRDGEHDGLTDAYNTSLLFTKIISEATLKLNSIYQAAKSEKTVYLYPTLEYLLAGMKLQFA